ncbi:AAA family ATPase [Vibrio algivorus]|uniref:AAA family ATPase n=1 Tax=Vibrio algivorus TaxID=1667024 RepID=A0A557P347_9VIBR|nr:ATP-binding protein [Vibrio algivorus]TVO35090.1 AAA family ATPase [Vibrio algivorus]
MIKNFGVKNFASIGEGIEVSFEFDGNTPENVSNGQNIGTVLGIKGANGSGKTNILKAISFLFSFVSKRIAPLDEDGELKGDVNLPLDSFFHNTDPSEFYLEFVCDETKYHYEVTLKSDGILTESLIRNVGGKTEFLVFHRENEEILECEDGLQELKTIKLRADQSIISLPNDYKFHTSTFELELINEYFKKFIFNVGQGGMRYDGYNGPTERVRSQFYFENKDAFNFVKKIIKSCDDGIDDIQIKRQKGENGGFVYFPEYIHKYKGKEHKLAQHDEAMGTKVLFSSLYKYWLTLTHGGLLIVDEFDIHLHSMILPEILGLFTNTKINKKSAQLIFTAHNTEIIDSLGRYRTILVNKEDNETYCFRLDKVSVLRNDRAITPVYLKGKIGGVPKLKKANILRALEG